MEKFEESRLEICNSCPYNLDKVCILCGCFIEKKIKNKDEACPHTPSFWGAIGEQKVYKQPAQMKIAGQEPKSSTQQSNECIPCKNRH